MAEIHQRWLCSAMNVSMLTPCFQLFRVGEWRASCKYAMGSRRVATVFLFLGTALMAQTPAPDDQPHPWRQAEPSDAQPPQLAAPERADPPFVAQGTPNQTPPPPPPVFTSNPSFS